MQHLSRQQLLARWDESSDVLRGAIFSDVNESIFDNLEGKFHLSDGQRADMAHLCLLVLLGFISYRNVAQELQDGLGLGAATALSLYQEINTKIFGPISKEIEDNYLKFKTGAVDEASVQKPSVVPQVNLKTPQPEGTVNLKKEDTGPKILSVGGFGAQNGPVSHPLAKQGSSVPPSGPSMLQKKEDVVAASRPAVRQPQDGGKDIFSLSPKDRWGIETENIVASRRIMGQPQASPVPPSFQASAPSLDSKIIPSLSPTGDEKNILPVVEESHLPEVIPPQPRSAVSQFQSSEEKKITAPEAAPFLETKKNPPVPQAPLPSGAGIAVNIQMNPGGGSASGWPAASAANNPVFPQAIGANAPKAPLGSDAATRPMQWAAPTQPARQPDVVVEIRQTQVGAAASDGGAFATKKEDAPVPVRPMRTASFPQSATPTHQITKEGGLTAAPMGSARQPSTSSQPLDPNEAIDIGPVIIHKHDDPSVAHAQSGAQYKDFSNGAFSGNFSSQISHQNVAPSVANVEVPAPVSGGVGGPNAPARSFGQPAGGYQQMAPPPPPSKKGGLFSFFKK